MANDVIKGTQINSKGFGTISKLVMQDRNLTVIAKSIYAYLNSFAGGGNTCFPGKSKMCLDLNISKDTLSKYIKQLSDYGYIKVEQERLKGKFSHNVYVIQSEIKIMNEELNNATTVTDTIVTEETVSEEIVSDDIVSDEIAHNTNNNNINNNNINRININSDNIQSSYQSTYTKDVDRRNERNIFNKSDTFKTSDYEKYERMFKRQIDYDILIADSPNDKEIIEQIVELMCEVVLYYKKPIYINGESIPSELVKSRYKKLDQMDIQNVLYNFEKNSASIKNIKSYLITVLYNIKQFEKLKIQAQVRHDMMDH